MASKEVKLKTTQLLSEMFRIDWLLHQELNGQWDSVLDGMTNQQVEICVWHLSHAYTSQWAPTPAMFKSWLVEAKETHEGLPLAMRVDELGRVLIAAKEVEGRAGGVNAGKKIPVPRLVERPYEPEEVSPEEYEQRLKTIQGIMNGTMHRNIDWSNFRGLRRENIQQRNWLREQLGWSLIPLGVEGAPTAD